VGRTFVIRPRRPVEMLDRLGLRQQLLTTGQTATVRVNRVEVDPETRTCTLIIELLSPDGQKQLDDLVQQVPAYESWDGLDVQLQWEVRTVDFATRLRAAWDELVQELSLSQPLLRTWLPGARLNLRHSGGEMCADLIVEAAIAREILVQRAVLSQARARFREAVGAPVQVSIRIDPASEDAVRYGNAQLSAEEEAAVRSILEQRKRRQEQRLASGRVLFGEVPAGEPQSISLLESEHQRALIEGEVMSVDARMINSGRQLLTLEVTDRSDSVTVKLFSSPDGAKDLAAIEPGDCVRLSGQLQYDAYLRELVLMAEALAVVPSRARVDDETDKRIELHLHTHMSALDSVAPLKRLVELAGEWGHEALAITDHGVVQSFPEAQQLGKQHGVQIIYGVEGYLVNEDDPRTEGSRPFHIVILAATQDGLTNLYRLISLSHLDYFYRVPRIPRRELAKHRDGLLLGTACEAGELFQAALAGTGDDELAAIASWYDYIELQPRGNNRFLVESGQLESVEALEELNRRLYELGLRLDMPVVATGDVHFVEPDEEIYRCILQSGQGYSDTDHQAPLYFRTTGEMLEEFSYLGEDAARAVVVEGPHEIAGRIGDLKPVPDGLYAPHMPGADTEIRQSSFTRARQLYGDPLPTLVKERLETELESIVGNGFAGIYLLAERMVKKSLSDGYLVGSRGSVGSSLVATMCGITEVNPLPPHYYCPACQHTEFISDGSVSSGFDLPQKECPACGTDLKRDGHDIPFAVFMGFEGDKVPDIDLNFSGAYQGRMHRYVEELLGPEKVFRAGTISTIADRTAYGFVRGYLDDQGRVARQAEVNRLIRGVTGVKRTTGQHPGGLMVVPEGRDIHEFTPVQRPANDRESDTITTHFDYHSISDRLIKLDILGHDDPTVIRLLQDMTGVDITDVPFDDPMVLSLFSGLEAIGVDAEELQTDLGSLGLPEFGTRFVRQMLRETRPQTFSELVRISGLSHGTDVWLTNAQELIREGTADLRQVIATRDDIMTNLRHRGMESSLAFTIMESVRKGKGLLPEEERAMRDCGTPPWYIESCKKIKYMFPKAHAVAYVMMALRIAYFKVYHPGAFYAAYFTVRGSDFDASYAKEDAAGLRRASKDLEMKGSSATAKERSLLTTLEVALEMRLRGIKFVPVDIERSAAETYILVKTDGENPGLLCPFNSVQGLGTKAAQSIVDARDERPFTSIEDLVSRTRLSRTLVTLLKDQGALEGLPASNQLGLF